MSTITSVIRVNLKCSIPANFFVIYRRNIFYPKSARIFHTVPIISEDLLRRFEDTAKSFI